METSVVILKPDVFKREERLESDKLIKPLPEAEEFIAYVRWKLQDSGLEIVRERKEKIPREVVELHYAEHKENREKFEFLKQYITSGVSYIMLIGWEDAQPKARKIIMDLREEFLQTPQKACYNMTHASWNKDEAAMESKLHFGD